MSRVFIGLGSNVGHRRVQLQRAVELLARSAGIQLMRCASIYETAPVGYTQQPAFLNTVVQVSTTIEPRALLQCCKDIERELGRAPRPRGHEREIDLDILLYGSDVIDEDDLRIPHPELHRRRFVLIPLVELDPALVHPALGRTVRALLRDLDLEGRDREQRVVKGGDSICAPKY